MTARNINCPYQMGSFCRKMISIFQKTSMENANGEPFYLRFELFLVAGEKTEEAINKNKTRTL